MRFSNNKKNINFMKILKGKIFWFLVTFGLSSVSFMLGYPILGAIFMVYPVVLTLIGIAYGFIINPLREHKDHKRYMSYTGKITGRVLCDGEPVGTVKVVVRNASGEFDIDTSNYYVVTDLNGYYTIPHIKNGDFVCSAWKNGYSSFEKPFKISNSETINIDINMTKE